MVTSYRTLQNRVTHRPLRLLWKHSPLRTSSILLKSLLLPPRSAPLATPLSLSKKLLRNQSVSSYSLKVIYTFTAAWYRETRFSAIHFRGRCIRQVSCYTLLSGCRLPWPPSNCPYPPTPFSRIENEPKSFDATYP